MSLALALDLGTTSIAAVAVDAEGRLVAHVQLPNDSGLLGQACRRDMPEQNPLRIREPSLATVLEPAGGQSLSRKNRIAWD